MDHIGTWVFHSIGAMNDKDELVYLSAEDYLNSPMPYVDETDEEAVADEMKERKKMVGMQVKICEDGKLYLLSPLPEGVSQEEVDKAVSAGVITLLGGMMAERPLAWEERDGELWYDTGIEGEVFGEKVDGWVKAIDKDGYFTVASTRFVKA
ncbi:MAG: hypothetical protein IJ002_03885 [Clostridia bacterium]|nr:hypothetical protein [Clostridia bacterium]